MSAGPTPRSSFLAALLPLLSCAPSGQEVPDKLDITDIVPGGASGTEGAGGADGSSGTGGASATYTWEGPEVAAVEGRAWGGLGINIPDLGCSLWWQLVGDEVPCDSCDLAFEVIAEGIGDTCGVGVSDVAFQLEFVDGRAYGFDLYWGASAIGGGVAAWDGTSDAGYHYYGFIHYP